MNTINYDNILNTIWKDRILFFEDTQFAKIASIELKSLQDNGFRKTKGKAAHSYYLRLEKKTNVTDYSYDSLASYVEHYNNTKDFFNRRIKDRKMLLKQESIIDFFNYAFTLYYNRTKAKRMLSKLKEGSSREKKVSEICIRYYDTFVKRGKIIDISMLFLMYHELMPFQDRHENMSPERYFLNLMDKLDSFMKGNSIVENLYEDNIPNSFYEITKEIDEHITNKIYYNKDGEIPFFNVLKLISIIDTVLFNYYDAQYSSEVYKNVKSVESELMRVFVMDGFWKDKENLYNTNKFWHIEYMPYSNLYLFRKFEKDTKDKKYYTTSYSMQCIMDEEHIKFLIYRYDHSYYTVTQQKIPRDTTCLFSSPNAKIEDDCVTCSEFNLIPDAHSNIGEEWNVFKNKTFVKVSETEQSYYQAQINQCELENRYPKLTLEFFIPDIAITRTSILSILITNIKKKFLK